MRRAIGSSLDSDADSELREVMDEKRSMSNSHGLQQKGGSCVLVGVQAAALLNVSESSETESHKGTGISWSECQALLRCSSGCAVSTAG